MPETEAIGMDLCDACSAAAMMIFDRGSQTLSMCLHHGRQHTDALLMAGWVETKTAAYDALLAEVKDRAKVSA